MSSSIHTESSFERFCAGHSIKQEITTRRVEFPWSGPSALKKAQILTEGSPARLRGPAPGSGILVARRGVKFGFNPLGSPGPTGGHKGAKFRGARVKI